METIANLRSQYLALVNTALPNAAKPGGYPVHLNHCFGGIVLDNLFQCCWYDRLSRKSPAYKQLSEAQLTEAIAIAESMLASADVCTALNHKSLIWRGKVNVLPEVLEVDCDGEDADLKTLVTLRHAVTGRYCRVVVLSAEQADPIEFCRSALVIWDQWHFVDAEVVWSDCF